MLTLIRRARRRLLYNELLSQGANAVSAALVAFILLLLLGTEILNWYWTLLIPAAAVAVALYRVRQRLPPPYVSAQIVDRRMDLADSLSTAIYFNGPDASKTSPDLLRLQAEQAERMAAGVDVRRAIPFLWPRTAYVMAALILVASSLFALRYGLTRRLDLNQPMARILQQALGLDPTQTASAPHSKNLRLPDAGQQDGDNPVDADKPSDDPSLQAGDPLDDNKEPQDAASGKQADKNSKDKDEEAKAGSQNGEDQQGQGEPRASDDQNSGKGPENEKQNQQAAGQDPNGSSNSSSLLSKVKDAVKNMLSSMKQQPAGANSQQQNQSAQNSPQKGQQNAGKQSQKGEKTSGQAGGEEQDPDLSSESQQAENAPGKGDDSKPSNKQPGGGIGTRDGSKDVKAAEQLAAMGKITQIIGKRSATLSGEATVEVQSTVQQLRTTYSDSAAQHADAGGDIGRDEIPVALESYVQQYFEQVRKQPAPKK
ncbi:MAG: hypothetical protein LAP40_00360 [Acidobacteriia bacterium]|nr:hypothetical protein [Terriglobia bacterium]